MLMMLAPRGVFWQKVGAADAHDAGSPCTLRQKVGAADAYDAGSPRHFSAKGWSC